MAAVAASKAYLGALLLLLLLGRLKMVDIVWTMIKIHLISGDQKETKEAEKGLVMLTLSRSKRENESLPFIFVVH